MGRMRARLQRASGDGRTLGAYEGLLPADQIEAAREGAAALGSARRPGVDAEAGVAA